MAEPIEVELTQEQQEQITLSHAVVKATEAVQAIWWQGMIDRQITCSLDEFKKLVITDMGGRS